MTNFRTGQSWRANSYYVISQGILHCILHFRGLGSKYIYAVDSPNDRSRFPLLRWPVCVTPFFNALSHRLYTLQSACPLHLLQVPRHRLFQMLEKRRARAETSGYWGGANAQGGPVLFTCTYTTKMYVLSGVNGR